MSELSFDGQMEGEKVKFIFRRHILTARKGILWLILFMALGFAPILIWPGQAIVFWIWIGCIAIGIIGLVYTYMLWYFSLYIVTDQRIRQISQRGLFKKTVVDLGLDKIQSISYSVPGLFAGIFRYGTLLIQTQVGDMVISSVPKPEKIYNRLQRIVGKANHD